MPLKDYTAPDDSAPEFGNFIARIVGQIVSAKRGDNFDTCCALVGCAYVLAREDAAHSVALARYLVSTARELDPDCCEAIRWQ
jgi:hypothetical protein